MGINALDIGQTGALIAEQAVANGDRDFADDGRSVFGQQIVNSGDGAGGRVFDGEDAVVTPAAGDGFKDVFKGFVGDAQAVRFEKPQRGFFGVGSGGAGIGDGAAAVGRTHLGQGALEAHHGLLLLVG